MTTGGQRQITVMTWNLWAPQQRLDDEATAIDGTVALVAPTSWPSGRLGQQATVTR